MIIIYRGKAFRFEGPVVLLEALKTMENDSADILACRSGGEVIALNETVREDCRLEPITFQDEEGRRIYERSLRFVLLYALHQLYPDAKVRIEHSIGYGIYLRLINRFLNRDDLQQIDSHMRGIIDEDLPFVPLRLSKDEIIRHFREIGEMEKSRILSFQPSQVFTLYRLGDYTEYFYGAMLPSTGFVRCFSLRLVFPGIVMMMPSPANPKQPAPFIHRPKNLSAFEESNRWCRLMGITNAADLNDLISRGQFREMVRVNEALHDKSIARIADSICQARKKAVFIAGPSSSGKTTFANRMRIHLKVLGFDPVLLSLDDFYLDREAIPPDPDTGKPDLEHLNTLDLPYLKRCINQLLSGEEAQIPHFDFKTGKRAEAYTPLRLHENQMLLFEGIHALNPLLHDDFDSRLTCRVYISELTCMNLDDHSRIRTTDARLLRRITRDWLFRGTSPEKTLDMWASVRRGEEKWIFPYQENIDFIFNSVLHYELPVFRTVIFDSIRKIGPDSPNTLAAQRLVNLLQYFLPVPEREFSEIPPLSILREFIGGCTFYDP